MGSCREQIKLHDLNKEKGQYKKRRIYVQYEYKGKQPRFITHFETVHEQNYNKLSFTLFKQALAL